MLNNKYSILNIRGTGGEEEEQEQKKEQDREQEQEQEQEHESETKETLRSLTGEYADEFCAAEVR